jgi:hypothetical protein
MKEVFGRTHLSPAIYAELGGMAKRSRFLSSFFRSFSMVFQNLYQSRLFRAVAAMMLCLVVLTACSETANEVAKSTPSAPQAAQQDVATQAATFTERARNNQLTVDETEMMSKFTHANATKKILALQNQKTLKFYQAVQDGKKEALETALANERHEEVLALIGFTKEEAKEYVENSKKAHEELLVELGASKDLFVKYGSLGKTKGNCLTCDNNKALAGHRLDMYTKKSLDHLLIPIPDNTAKRSGSVQGCSWIEWWNSLAFAAAVVVLTAGLQACQAAAASVAAQGNVPGGIMLAFACVDAYILLVQLTECWICHTNC